MSKRVVEGQVAAVRGMGKRTAALVALAAIWSYRLVLSAAFGFVLLAGAVLASVSIRSSLSNGSPEESPGEAFCNLASWVRAPNSFGVQQRIARAIRSEGASGSRSYDFSGLSKEWSHICLTSVDSGELTFSEPARPHVPPFELKRDVCWGWSAAFLTVLAINQEGRAVPVKWRLGGFDVGTPIQTDYSALPRSSGSFRQCAPVAQAKASCVTFPSSKEGGCFLLFPL